MQCNKKIIYLVSYPFSQRDYVRFGVKNWINHGWSVDVYDVTSILHINIDNNTMLQQEDISIPFKIFAFDNLFNLISSLEKINNRVVFVDLISSYSLTYKKIVRIAKKNGVIIKLNLGALPVASINMSSVLSKIKRIFSSPIKMIGYYVSYITYNLFVDYDPDFIVLAGKKTFVTNKYTDSKIIMAHNLDYDLFLSKDKDKGGGIVFLDGAGPYHPDFITANITPEVTAEKYYKTVDSGLLKISTALGYDVKVAAHPRSNYNNTKYKYSFPILENNTFELIRKSNIVVSHGSTALQLAILMKKPIIIVTTNEMKASLYNSVTESYALCIDKKVINLDDNLSNYDWGSELIVSNEKYKEYVDDYVKHPKSPERQAWDIIIDQIESYA